MEKVHSMNFSFMQGPRSKILTGGLKREPAFFSGGSSGMLPLENLGFSYSQLPEGGS